MKTLLLRDLRTAGEFLMAVCIGLLAIQLSGGLWFNFLHIGWPELNIGTLLSSVGEFLLEVCVLTVIFAPFVFGVVVWWWLGRHAFRRLVVVAMRSFKRNGPQP